MKKPITARSWVLLGLAIASVSLSGCSVEKARSLQGAALQFRNESLSAIDAIDTMRKRELEAPRQTDFEIRQGFTTRILNTKQPINGDLIDFAIDPFKPPDVAEWENFVTNLHRQYEGFNAIFEQLDSRSLVSRNEVKKSAEYARTLTVQMALLADAISKNPPVLIQYRVRVVNKFRKLRQEYQTVLTKLNNGSGSIQQLNQRKYEMENQAGELLGEWQQIKQEEQRLLETTVAQCLKAATVGKEVIQAANNYDHLDINQLNAVVTRVLSLVFTLTGKDYSTLRSRTTVLISDIQADPLWSATAQRLIERTNSAASGRVSTKIIQAEPISFTGKKR
jgi:hypothetical protein